MTDSIVTIGRFDGVHVGHQAIIKQVVETAVREGARSVVLTFDRHPMKTLKPHSHPEILTPTNLRLRLIKALGVDEVRLIKFDKTVSCMEPAEFLDKILLPLQVRELLVGKDFRFGRDRSGDINFVGDYARDHGFKLSVVPFFKIDGMKVGSSKIRSYLKGGDIVTSKMMLGRNPSFTGVVIKGERIGSDLGFPTANLKPDPDLCLPKTGVYAGIVSFDGRTYDCLVNVGFAPTFHARSHPLLEVHVPGQDLDMYGKEILVELTARIRDEREFKDKKDLIEQILDDASKLRDMIR